MLFLIDCNKRIVGINEECKLQFLLPSSISDVSNNECFIDHLVPEYSMPSEYQGMLKKEGSFLLINS